MGSVPNSRDRIRKSLIGAAFCGLPWALSVALAIPPGTAAAQDASESKLPEIHVIATSPVAPPPRTAPARVSAGAAPARTAAPGAPAAPTPAASAETAPAKPVPGAVDADKIPSNVVSVGAPDFSVTKTPDLSQAMVRSLPGVSLSDEEGNPFQLDLNYRGFTASPLPGTTQSMAVYQNGVRINEAFGDIVNWDFIPQNAIHDLTLYPSNPIFGLNAIGGALSFQMKNGFTYQGVEGEVKGGSYGRVGTSIQAGGQNGNLSGYFTADAINDAGWRDLSSSTLRRMYADLGARGDDTEYHVTFTAADNTFGAAGSTPVQILNQDWSGIYTVPQTTETQLAMATASAAWKPSDTWTFQAVTYFRHYSAQHNDGNSTDVSTTDDNGNPCMPSSGGFSTLCLGSGTPLLSTTSATNPVLNSGSFATANNTTSLGEIDRTWTTSNSFGGSVQAASSEPVFGHPNNFVVGTSVDYGLTQFTSTSELGTCLQDQFPVCQGSGLFINDPADGVSPVSLASHNLYTGIYATDTLDLTNRLSVTGGARYNIANIVLEDELGNDSDLNGNDTYTHFNPMIGATYKITPNVTAYADYAVANRAPTPLELECSDPTRPCLIDTALVADPPLKQVVTYTYEAGLRGQFDLYNGHATWNAGVFHALNTDDIINAFSNISNHEFFQNAGDTERKGIEAAFNYKQNNWNVYANYTYVDAVFLNSFTLQSPNNPFADANGNIFVQPGDHLTGIPDYRFKVGGEYQVTPKWLFGADLNAFGSQWYVGDEANQNPKLPAYWTVNLHSTYKISDNLEVFGLVQNLFDRHYALFGTFFETDNFAYFNFNNPQSLIGGMPFAAYLGLRGTLPSGVPVFAAEKSGPIITKATPTTWTPPAAVNWTGVYVGLNGGFTYGGSDWVDSVTGTATDWFSTLGFVFGGTVGANYQVGSWVVGIEGDGDWADSNGYGTFGNTAASSLCAGGCFTKNTWLATARGRAGYAFDRFLVYGTGGAAFGSIQANFANDPVTTSTVTGWTAGGGAEYSLGGGWSAKAEYLFVDLGNGSCTTNCAIQTPSSVPVSNPNAFPVGTPTVPNVAVKFYENIVRAGISYKFGS